MHTDQKEKGFQGTGNSLVEQKQRWLMGRELQKSLEGRLGMMRMAHVPPACPAITKNTQSPKELSNEEERSVKKKEIELLYRKTSQISKHVHINSVKWRVLGLLGPFQTQENWDSVNLNDGLQLTPPNLFCLVPYSFHQPQFRAYTHTVERLPTVNESQLKQ